MDAVSLSPSHPHKSSMEALDREIRTSAHRGALESISGGGTSQCECYPCKNITKVRGKKTMFNKVLILGAASLLLIGCGGGGGSYGSGGGGGGSTMGQAQGAYSGTSSSGFAFETIVLPNDKIYALYGTVSGNVFLIYGLITGQGHREPAPIPPASPIFSIRAR